MNTVSRFKERMQELQGAVASSELAYGQAWWQRNCRPYLNADMMCHMRPVVSQGHLSQQMARVFEEVAHFNVFARCMCLLVIRLIVCGCKFFRAAVDSLHVAYPGRLAQPLPANLQANN